MLEKFPLYIPPFGQSRSITIYLPKGYEAEKKRYPVLYMHDGQNVFCDEAAVGGVSLDLERLLDEEGMELIVVAIEASTEKYTRVNEYCAWEGGALGAKLSEDNQPLTPKGKAYVDWIVQDLKPLIDGEYRTMPDHTSMAGISLGGSLSIFAAYQYPHIFKRIGAISSGFYRNQEKLEEVLREADLAGVDRVYMDCGTEEAGKGAEVSEEFLASNQAVYEILKEKIADVSFAVAEGEDHSYPCFRKRMPGMLACLFEKS